MSLKRLSTQYDLTIEVLSPVHIGSGTDLTRDHDYVLSRGRTWVIDQEALLMDTLPESGEFDNQLLGRPAGELLRAEDFKPGNPIFRYILPGETKNRPLREYIKDVWGSPYIPGSSIKGMLRTLILWGIYTANEQFPDLQHLHRNGKQAAQPLEHDRLAPGAPHRNKAPNFDVFRALHVADTDPVEINSLHVASTLIYPTSDRGRGGVIVDVEALRRNVTLQTSLSIDEYGFDNRDAGQQMQWDDLRVWFNRLPALGKHQAGMRIAEEDKYHQAHGPNQARSFYKSLYGIWQELGKNEWLAQIGWGTGWKSKTLNNLLTDQGDFKRQVFDQYRLGRRGQQYNRKTGFPVSRNLKLDKNGQPAVPMGWIKCRLDKRGR